MGAAIRRPPVSPSAIFPAKLVFERNPPVTFCAVPAGPAPAAYKNPDESVGSVSQIIPTFLPCPSPIKTKRRTPVPLAHTRQRSSVGQCRPGRVHGGEEGRGEAGPARRQAQAEGHPGRLRSPRNRRHRGGHEGPEDDGDRHRRPRPPRRKAAQQVLRHGADGLRRPGQGGEEGRRQERRRKEGGRQEGPGQAAGVPAVLLVWAAAAVPLPLQRRGGPQLVRHLLKSARAADSLCIFCSWPCAALPIDHAFDGDRRRTLYIRSCIRLVPYPAGVHRLRL